MTGWCPNKGNGTLEDSECHFDGYCSECLNGNKRTEDDDVISRQEAVDDWMEKCMTCTHVYQRVDDIDTLYCRCRKGCKYEEVEIRRSNNDPQRHES